ncbi:MAG: TonB-dependent receptor [Cyclobacteriaceae bacterium]
MRARITFLVLITVLALHARGQAISQTIRGNITDADSNYPLIGASVVVVGSEPVQGAITDIDGIYRIQNVNVGRITLKISFVGYEDRFLRDLIVSSAKESIIDIGLVESVENLDAIVVTAKQSKSEVLNEMATVSARSFSVEETQRYAGAISDPARMVSSFAGVNGNAEGNNDIVVRGNNSRGILWRLEGVEIPNPNHFGGEGTTGGPINALNSFMLNDSDFFTGAFAPEYGNALSGVFDMKLKKGNNQQREYTARFSTLGIDATAEGPFSENYNGSYLANYRYSSLALIAGVGFLDFGGIPKYQDVSFNVHLPLAKNQFISVFGLGGYSSISQEIEDEEEVEVLGTSEYSTSMGVAGVTHQWQINNKSFLKNTLSVSGTGLFDDSRMHILDYQPETLTPVNQSQFRKSAIKFASTYNLKINAKNKIENGLILTQMSFNMNDKRWSNENLALESVLSDKGSTQMYQAFSSWKYRPTDNLTFVSGLHFLGFGLNKSYAIEPRIGMKWKVSDRGTVIAGFGAHSRLESVVVYLAKFNDGSGNMRPFNEQLEPTKSLHFVLGYDLAIGSNVHLKTETYYQHLYDVPVGINNSYSLLNEMYDYAPEALVNEGSGRNYGIEFTAEQFLTRGFYYMSTLSLYQSFYTAMDEIERQSAFSGNYATNFLTGKEWKYGKKGKKKVFFTNAKLALLGGMRYTPIDLEASQNAGYEVLSENEFTQKGDDVFVVNLALGFRKDKSRTTQEFKIDVQNVTNNKAVVREYYMPNSGKIYESTQLGMFPTISYSLKF